MWATSTGSNTINKIDAETGAFTVVAGDADENNGSGCYSNCDGQGLSAGFRYPTDIVSDGTYLYVTDATNGTIRKIE